MNAGVRCGLDAQLVRLGKAAAFGSSYNLGGGTDVAQVRNLLLSVVHKNPAAVLQITWGRCR